MMLPIVFHIYHVIALQPHMVGEFGGPFEGFPGDHDRSRVEKTYLLHVLGWKEEGLIGEP